jgi:ATP-dependent helicase HrpB
MNTTSAACRPTWDWRWRWMRAAAGAAFRLLIMSATLEASAWRRCSAMPRGVRCRGALSRCSCTTWAAALPLLPGGAAPRSQRRRAWCARCSAHSRTRRRCAGVPAGRGRDPARRALLAQALPAACGCCRCTADGGAAQDAVLAPAAAGTRKVVLATNIAETSLTIPGVTAVVDRGLVRRSRFDPVTGMSRLDLRASRAPPASSAAGAPAASRPASATGCGARGRSSPGGDTPEILEADLAPLALELARWGADDAAQLRVARCAAGADAAAGARAAAAAGCADAQGRLTALGQDMARLPVHPRLAPCCWPRAPGRGATGRAARGAAVRARSAARAMRRSGDPDIRPPGAAARRFELRRGAEALERMRRTRSARALAAARCLAVQRPLRCRRTELAGALLALAFRSHRPAPPRRGAGRYLLANGRGAAFAQARARWRARSSSSRRRSMIANARRASIWPRRCRARCWSSSSRRDIVTEERFGWDARSAAVLARRVRRLDALVLEERTRPAADDERAVAAMLEGLRQLGMEALPWDARARDLQARMQFVRSLARPIWPTGRRATMQRCSARAWISGSGRGSPASRGASIWRVCRCRGAARRG